MLVPGLVMSEGMAENVACQWAEEWLGSLKVTPSVPFVCGWVLKLWISHPYFPKKVSIAFSVPLTRILRLIFVMLIPTLIRDHSRHTFLIFSCDLDGFIVFLLSHLTHPAVYSPDNHFWVFEIKKLTTFKMTYYNLVIVNTT